MLTIVLASSSPYRRELLSRFKLPFDVFSPDIDETPLMDEKAKDISFRLAREKVFKVANHYPNSLIIGSDQTAECQNQIIDKPNTHCLLNTKTKQVQECVIDFEVKYKELNREIIESYLLKEQAYNCVGSIKSEGLGITLLEYIKGEDPTALVGLPLIKLSNMLRNEGVLF
jgi:septum formation protein